MSELPPPALTQWHDYITEEKIMWLLTHVLQQPLQVPDGYVQPSYDLELIARCEAALTPAQRALYIKYMSSDIALKTYDGLTEAQCQLPETGDKFYWNFLTAPTDLRARCIWNVVADFAP